MLTVSVRTLRHELVLRAPDRKTADALRFMQARPLIPGESPERIDIDVERRYGFLSLSLPGHARHEGTAQSVLNELHGFHFDLTRAEFPEAALIHGGADHLVLALKSRAALAAMTYDLKQGQALMRREGLVTILFAYAETPRRFHTRNPFASGGVYEDPATGAATAAFAGYLRDIGWPHGGAIDIVQGEDMGMRSRLHADIPPAPGSSIRVSGTARMMEEG